MSNQKTLSLLRALGVALCVELVTFSLVTLPLKAQSGVTFPPTERVGAPERTGGGGTRNPVACVRGNTPLTVLAPTNNLGTTVSVNPTLFWYAPQTEAKSAEVWVYDEQDNEVYHTTLALKGTPGVMKLKLPETVSLKPDKNYYWQVVLVCNPEERSQDMWVEGWLKRTELSPSQKMALAQAKEPLQKAQVYAEAKVWQETLEILVQLRQNRPYDLKVTDAWRTLLESVGLDAIATAPLIECCTVNQEVGEIKHQYLNK